MFGIEVLIVSHHLMRVVEVDYEQNKSITKDFEFTVDRKSCP
jgi:hypothetical protein